jgi:acyl-CoA thioester hydrolase
MAQLHASDNLAAVEGIPAHAARFPAQLRWTDFDAFGHVHTSAHQALLDNSRSRFLRSVLRPDGGPLGWVLVHVSVDYLDELRFECAYDATCLIGVESFGRSSITTIEALESPDGRIVSRARSVVALWDPEAHAKVALSPEDRERLASLGAEDRRDRAPSAA